MFVCVEMGGGLLMDEICQASERARVEVGSPRCCDAMPAMGPRAGLAKRPLSTPDLHCFSVWSRTGWGGVRDLVSEPSTNCPLRVVDSHRVANPFNKVAVAGLGQGSPRGHAPPLPQLPWRGTASQALRGAAL